MAIRDGCQALELALAVDLELALQNRPRGRPAQPFTGLIDPRQRRHIQRRVAPRKRVTPAAFDLDAPRRAVPLDQTRTLRPTQTGHPLHVRPNQPLGGTLQPPILVVAKQRLTPPVDLGLAPTSKPNAVGECKKCLHLQQTQTLTANQENHPPIACRFRLIPYWNQSPPSGSSCVGQEWGLTRVVPRVIFEMRGGAAR